MISILPNYIKDISFDVLEKKQTVSFKLKCRCNHTKFIFYKSLSSQEEQLKLEKWQKLIKEYNGDGYSDSEGNVYVCTKGILGIGKKKLKVDENIIPQNIVVVKIKCSKCRQEYIIYDNRQYGYDGIVSKNLIQENGSIEFKQEKIEKTSVPVGIAIKIVNDVDYNEFVEEFGNELSKIDFTNAFTSINIYAETKNNKVLIFSEETA